MTQQQTIGAGFAPARRMEGVGVSRILAIGARAAEMRAEGRAIITLGAGEPDFATPDHVKQAAADAMSRDETKYTVLDGSPAMKDAVIEKFRRDNGLAFSRSEITVSAGAKQVLYNAFMATLDPGDEVIVPAPCWTSYLDIIRLAGGTPVVVPCSEEAGFRVGAKALERVITNRTRWVLLNSPSNPTGAAYSASDYAPVLDVLARAPHVWMMCDDIYEHLTYDGFGFVTPLNVAPDLRDRTLTINGVSKSFAMTGWRIGFGAGPAALIRAMAAVQSQSTSCPASISQAAAIAALTGPQDFLQSRAASFGRRRDMVVDRLNAIQGVTCRRPEGAFYTFANCAGLIGRTAPDGTRIDSDDTLCDWLLESAGVAVVPGSAFGLSPYFRISYAASDAVLRDALDRIAAACSTLG